MNLYTQKKVNKNTNFLTKKKHTLFDIPQSIRTSLDLDRLISETSKVSSAILVFFSASSTTKQQRVDCCVGAVSLGQALLIFFSAQPQQTVVRACTNRARSRVSFAKFLRTLAVGHVVGFGVFSFFIFWLTVFVACCWAVIGSGSDLVCCFFFFFFSGRVSDERSVTSF